jgi:DNA-binding GntR family transcriptional regulator
MDRLRRLHLPERRNIQIVIEEHQAIADAIAEREPELAQAFLRKHLSGTLANIENLCARFPEYVRTAAPAGDKKRG